MRGEFVLAPDQLVPSCLSIVQVLGSPLRGVVLYTFFLASILLEL